MAASVSIKDSQLPLVGPSRAARRSSSSVSSMNRFSGVSV